MRWTVNGSLLAVIPVFLVVVMMKVAFVPTDDGECQTATYRGRGTVVDDSGNLLSSVWVEVQDRYGKNLGQAMTDQEGQFLTEWLSSVACEQITIRVWGHGYAMQKMTYYPPNDGKAGEMPYHLRVRMEQ